MISPSLRREGKEESLIRAKEEEEKCWVCLLLVPQFRALRDVSHFSVKINVSFWGHVLLNAYIIINVWKQGFQKPLNALKGQDPVAFNDICACESLRCSGKLHLYSLIQISAPFTPSAWPCQATWKKLGAEVKAMSPLGRGSMFPQPWLEGGPEWEIHQLKSKHPDTKGTWRNNRMVIPILPIPKPATRRHIHPWDEACRQAR